MVPPAFTVLHGLFLALTGDPVSFTMCLRAVLLSNIIPPGATAIREGEWQQSGFPHAILIALQQPATLFGECVSTYLCVNLFEYAHRIILKAFRKSMMVSAWDKLCQMRAAFPLAV
ncbi:MAG: hypothetical protein B6243_03475 [Anaerolineaceae bacterium 4572_5.2]|nr:MAG: hypothetical protein B6243_03475 [Anaerolineaceae bacterium 4572_5.2]